MPKHQLCLSQMLIQCFCVPIGWVKFYLPFEGNDRPESALLRQYPQFSDRSFILLVFAVRPVCNCELTFFNLFQIVRAELLDSQLSDKSPNRFSIVKKFATSNYLRYRKTLVEV